MKRTAYFEGKIAGLSFKAEIFKDSLFMDFETPVGVFTRLLPHSSFILESTEKNRRFGRYSFICGENLLTAVFQRKTLTINLKKNSFSKHSLDPLEAAADLSYSTGKVEDVLDPFFGGFCGYLSYDAYSYIEPASQKESRKTSYPESYFTIPGFVICYDHYTHISNIYITKLTVDGEDAGGFEPENLRDFIIRKSYESIVSQDNIHAPLIPEGYSRFRSTFSKEEFKEAVRRALEYIYAGDAYQIVLSQRFSYPRLIHPFVLYRYLRIANPSPYMFYFPAGKITLAGASPEPLIKVENGIALTRPIAGTRPRGATEAEDRKLEEELLNDKKELAEHTMLVDLARNDLGRVSEEGTVQLTRRFEIERYSHVMHIVSEVTGKLKEGKTAVDALKAVFPAGTVSGAPKIRAAQIISELEPVQRGIYAGAFGYLSFTGNLDTCIAIRTAVIDKNFIHVQAGAGIVRDSIPEREYEETVNKAKGILEAVEKGVSKFAAAHR